MYQLEILRNMFPTSKDEKRSRQWILADVTYDVTDYFPSIFRQNSVNPSIPSIRYKHHGTYFDAKNSSLTHAVCHGQLLWHDLFDVWGSAL